MFSNVCLIHGLHHPRGHFCCKPFTVGGTKLGQRHSLASHGNTALDRLVHMGSITAGHVQTRYHAGISGKHLTGLAQKSQRNWVFQIEHAHVKTCSLCHGMNRFETGQVGHGRSVGLFKMKVPAPLNLKAT